MQDKEMKLNISLLKKSICLAITGRQPELPYPLKNVKCADGTVQEIYEIPDADKAKVFAALYPFKEAPCIDDVMFDLHEQLPFWVHEFLVIRWQKGNLLASPYFPHSGGMLLDWIPIKQAKMQGAVILYDEQLRRMRRIKREKYK